MVSQTLEAHFRNNTVSSEIDEKLANMLRFIDPQYLDSFKEFRANVLGIISENPGNEDIVLENLDEGILGLKDIKTSYDSRNVKAINLVSDGIGIEQIRTYNKTRKR